MAEHSDILRSVREVAGKRVLYLPHAIRQMCRPERMIGTAEVRAVIDKGEVVEDYRDDPRGHSCLILGRGHQGRAIHVVCSPKTEFLAVITAYLPDPAEWSDDLRKRRRQ